MTDVVKRPDGDGYDQMYNDLCRSEKKIFLSFKDMLVFAACLGYAKNSKKELIGKPLEPVGLHIFKGEFDDAVFQCIGLCEKETPSIMSDSNQDERVQLFEEYAAGGLEIIKSRIYDGPEDWDSALLGLIVEYGSEEGSILDDITGYAED